jgi:hypothetical protein
MRCRRSPRGRGVAGRADAAVQHGAGKQQGHRRAAEGTDKQQQGAVSSKAGMHASMHAREWGQLEGARGIQSPDMGPVIDVGVLEHCRFLPFRFGRWRAQLITEGVVLRWLFGRTSASVQGRMRCMGRTDEQVLG